MEEKGAMLDQRSSGSRWDSRRTLRRSPASIARSCRGERGRGGRGTGTHMNGPFSGCVEGSAAAAAARGDAAEEAVVLRVLLLLLMLLCLLLSRWVLKDAAADLGFKP